MLSPLLDDHYDLKMEIAQMARQGTDELPAKKKTLMDEFAVRAENPHAVSVRRSLAAYTARSVDRPAPPPGSRPLLVQLRRRPSNTCAACTGCARSLEPRTRQPSSHCASQEQQRDAPNLGALTASPTWPAGVRRTGQPPPSTGTSHTLE